MKMRTQSLALLFCFASFFPLQVLALEDATDLSRYKVVDETERLPTMQELKTMEDTARALLKKGDCATFVIAADEVANTANKLGNVIRRGLKPFYDADRDDRERIPRLLGKEFQQLIQAEAASNNLLLVRNEFWVREAICLIETGQRDQGINKLFRALDFVDPIKQEKLWKEAREAIWATVGYE